MKTLRLQSIFARVTACMVCLALSLTMIPSASAAQTATAPSWIDKSEYVTFSDGAAYQSDMWNTITTLRNYAQSGGEAPAYGKTYYKECETLSRSTSPSVQFELGLIKLKFALNAVAKGNRVPSALLLKWHVITRGQTMKLPFIRRMYGMLASICSAATLPPHRMAM